jgi:sugar phosphate isomerase/epimerase
MAQGGMKMKLGLINSAFAQVGVDFAEGIRHTSEIGFDTVDIHTEAWQISDAEKKLIIKECKANNLPIVSVPCCALGIADFTRPVRDFHTARAKSFVDLAHDLKARNVLLVLGEYIWQQEVIPPSAQWAWAVEEVRKIGTYAHNKVVEIVIELEPFRLSLVNNIAKMVSFIKEVDSPAVFANIDVSHVYLAGDDPKEIRRLKGLAHHVHFSDCNGKVHGDLPPGKGVIDFRPLLKEIKNLEIDGTLSIELEFCPEPEKIVQWVTDAYEVTARLMAEAGLRS